LVEGPAVIDGGERQLDADFGEVQRLAFPNILVA
jgi:hypothetical protein